MSIKRILKQVGAAFLAAAIVFVMPGAGTAARAAYENVLDDRMYNNEFLVIRRDPTGKVGKTMNIPVIIQAPYEMEDVWVGISRDISSYYEMPADGGTESGVQNTFPFEINESTFEPKKLGTIKEGSTKSITLTARVRRDMKEGYYCIPICIYQGG